MLQRCCDSAKFLAKRPTYKDCTVCSDWIHFMNFRAWMLTQDWQGGKELDKDILHPFNKIYSPDNCCFVDGALNSLLTTRKAARGSLPIGVHWYKRDKKFVANISIKGKQKNLGYFGSILEASNVYNHAKAAYIIEVASTITCIKIQAGLCIWAYLYRQGQVA